MSNDPKEPLLLDHEYDGIHELDNNLPRWWVWLFYITIIFSAVYLVYYHVAARWAICRPPNTQGNEGRRTRQRRGDEQVRGRHSHAAAVDRSGGVLEHGQQIYAKFCAPCHRADGGGLVGPNLTDDYWIHGSNFADNVKVIWNGVPAKGMITWKTILKPEEIYAVASYIYTLRGAKLATPGKPPENQAPAKPRAERV